MLISRGRGAGTDALAAAAAAAAASYCVCVQAGGLAVVVLYPSGRGTDVDKQYVLR